MSLLNKLLKDFSNTASDYSYYTYSVTPVSKDVPPQPYQFKDPERNKELVDFLKSKITFKFKKGDTVFFIAQDKFVEGVVQKTDLVLNTDGDNLSFYRVYSIACNGASYRGICESRLASSVQELYDLQKKEEAKKSNSDFFR